MRNRKFPCCGLTVEWEINLVRQITRKVLHKMGENFQHLWGGATGL